MSPLFCNVEVPFESIGEHMQDYIRKYQISEKPRQLLVGGMRAKKLLLASPLLKWYLDHGLEVTRVHQIIEFTPKACFKTFEDQISTARRSGDVDPAKSIIADTMKLIGNSAYGSMIMSRERHQNVKYLKGEHKARLAVNDKKFRRLTELDDGVYESEMAKNRIRLDLPTQVGFFILQLAKLRMLAFYYDVIDYYVDRSDFELCAMDTDSNYFAFSTETIEQCIKPELREEFFTRMHEWFPSPSCEEHRNDFIDARILGADWIQEPCCIEKQKYDKRTPGLFKEEYRGDVIISLCSKTYCVENWEEKAAKFSSKGVSKRGYNNPINIYRGVLESQIAASGTNLGFRARNNKIFTYEQVRTGFSYLYCKRLVLPDGRSTKSLDIELCPWPNNSSTLTGLGDLEGEEGDPSNIRTSQWDDVEFSMDAHIDII